MKKPGPGLGISLAMLGIGVVLVIGGLIFGVVRTAGDALTTPVRTVPGTYDLELRSGEYRVFERTGTESNTGAGTFRTNSFVTLTSESLRVESPSGATLGVRTVRNNETITRGSRVFTVALAFTAPESGRYRLTFTANPTEVIVVRSLADSLGEAAPGFLAALVGGILGLAGLVMLIVGLVRRGRADRGPQVGYAAPQGYGAPPPQGFGGPPPGPWPPQQTQAPAAGGAPQPGWYPDPDGRSRYWDGTRWTDHTR